MPHYVVPFDFGEAVYIDNDTELVGRVLAVMVKGGEGCLIQVGWIHNGDSKSDWFHSWRLRKAPESKKTGEVR
jgi:hypothetical protein